MPDGEDASFMPFFRKSSLERLKQKINLFEVLSEHIELKRFGASYKALCPFHDEKTPSFVLQQGQSHYHCFGCGAHGDAIEFLMSYQKLNFQEAVESLAQTFQVPLEYESESEEKGPSKSLMKNALSEANQYFQFCLLHTEEGHKALSYLQSRGLSISFVQRFGIGLAPVSSLLQKILQRKKYSVEVMEAAGLVRQSHGRCRDFFSDRITFPVHSPNSELIGFSARKYREETFGGKYVNSPETPVFKKSHILYGLHHCRRRIAKEGRVILVEGQIDVLRLIDCGLDLCLASQGTAFGQNHVKKLLELGVREAYLAFDADTAGKEASLKVGDALLKEGIDVFVVPLAKGSDPDSFLRTEGIEGFVELLDKSIDYLSFLVESLRPDYRADSPAAKAQLATRISKMICAWQNPLLVHESLRKLASLLQVPEETLGVGFMPAANIYSPKTAKLSPESVDPHYVLEMDFLRWIFLFGKTYPNFVETALRNIEPDDLKVASCKKFYLAYCQAYQKGSDLEALSLAIEFDDEESQNFMAEILKKKVKQEKAEELFYQSIQKLLDRRLLAEREEIKRKLQSGKCNEEEALELARQFSALKPKSVLIA